MELGSLNAWPRRAIVAVVLLLVVALAGWFWLRRANQIGASSIAAITRGITSGARAPTGVRIRVQVLNTTRTRGLGRRATQELRDRGFDVVETGTVKEPRDSTLVLDRSNHPEWARLVAAAMGGGRVDSRPDSSRYVDVTVLIGGSWRPPTEPLYP